MNEKHKKLKIIGIISLAIICIIILSIGYYFGGSGRLNKNNSESVFKEEEDEKEEVPLTRGKDINVEIKGEVKNPDVYILKEGSRVKELIEKSGGITDKADLNSVKQAKKLIDGETIIIPTKVEGNNQNAVVNANGNNNNNTNANVNSSTNNNDGLININTATEAELKTLTGIGDTRAKAIIKYREENGGFNSIEDIMKVPGIKEGYFNKFKDKICY